MADLLNQEVINIERLEFKDYEELAYNISNTFESIDDAYGDVSVVAKYNEAKEIIRELLCIGYDVASIKLHREDFEEYWDEYLLTLNIDGIWCEKFKRENRYSTDTSDVIYIMDNCSSTVIRYCDSEYVYEVSTDNMNEDSEYTENEHTYMIDGKPVDKETFDKYVYTINPYFG